MYLNQDVWLTDSVVIFVIALVHLVGRGGERKVVTRQALGPCLCLVKLGPLVGILRAHVAVGLVLMFVRRAGNLPAVVGRLPSQPLRALLEIGRTDYGQLVVLDEFHESESHVSDAIGWLDHNDKPPGTIHCEHEPADMKKLDAAGYRTERADKSLDAGIDEVRNRLEHDTDDRPGLSVSGRCENLIQEFLGYKEEHVGTTQAVDHCLDSLRYALMGDSTATGAPTATANVGSDDGGDGNGGNGDNPIMDAIKQTNRRQKRVQRGNKWK